MPAGTLHSSLKTRHRCVGSRYYHIRALSTTVATQPFSPNKSDYMILCGILSNRSGRLVDRLPICMNGVDGMQD